MNPRATYMPFPFQIFHNKEALVFSYEYAGAVRNIALSDPGPAPIDSWMGQSWAQWSGDTLLVRTDGLNDQTWLDRAGNFHSEVIAAAIDDLQEGDLETGSDVGAYNSFWMDPGTRALRVRGEPRSSIIIDPADGQIPYRLKAQLRFYWEVYKVLNWEDNPECPGFAIDRPSSHSGKAPAQLAR